MTATEKGNIGERIIINTLIARGHQNVIHTKYHEIFDIIVENICKIEVKMAYLKKGKYNFCLPAHSRSDLTVLICEGWKTFVIPSHLLHMQNLKLAKGCNKYNEYTNRFDLVSSHIHQMKVLERMSNVNELLR